MSLARIALRMSAVEALRGRTDVGQNVLDSPNGAIDIQADGDLRIEEEKPFIAVFTDEATADDVMSRSLIGNGRCVLVIEIGISEKMTELDPETGETRIVGINVPSSDEAFEFFLDIVKRQVVDALTDPDSEWADIYRSLHGRVLKIDVGGKRNTADGQRLAGHQTRITVDLIEDPVFGEALNDDAPFARFMRALEASDRPNHSEHVLSLRRFLPAGDPDWKVLQRRHGLTRAELLALGRGPIVQDVPRETPILREGEGEVHRA